MLRVLSAVWRAKALQHGGPYSSCVLGRATQVNSVSSAAHDSLEVCFIDPRMVLEPERLQGGGPLQQQATQRVLARYRLPAAFLQQLSKGQHELGDMDDPGNSWYFGQRGEIFEYTLVGSHLTRSGYTSILPAEEVAAIAAGRRTAGLPSWRDFKEDMEEGAVKFPSIAHPFLFAGLLVDTPEAAVYALHQAGQLAGLLISSEGTGAADDSSGED